MTLIKLIVFWLFFFCSSALADNYYELLKKADSIRGSDIQQFDLIINKISNVKSNLNKNELDYFRYLQAYKKSITGNFISALKDYIDLSKHSVNPTIKFRAILSIINTYAIMRNWEKGLNYTNSAIVLASQIKDKHLIEKMYAVLGVFYNMLEQYSQATDYAEKILAYSTNQRNICTAYQTIIEAQLHTNKLDKQLVEKGLEYCHSNNEKLLYYFIVSHQAKFLQKSEHFKESNQLLLINIKDVETIHYPALNEIYYSLLANNFYHLNSLSEAQKFAQKTLDSKASFIGTQATVNAYRILYQIAKKQGNYRAALQYHEQYMKSNNAYLDEVKAKALAYQLAEHQSLEQKNQIHLLDKQNNLLKTQQKLAKTEAENNRLFISLLIALATLLLFWLYKNKLTQQKLKQLAEYDTLTRLINRGHFTQLSQSLLAKLKRQQKPVSMIMFDLDKFKAVNDTYGHATGDWVLKQVSIKLSKIVRKNDVLARLGGEEFAILLANCDLSKAQELANYYRQAIADINSKESGFEFPISASFGVTDNQLSGYKLDTLLAHADYALYASKRGGRNQVTAYNASIPAINVAPSQPV